MKATPFAQANKVLKAPPGQEGEVQDLHVWSGDVEGVPRCISRWEPSQEERAAIAAGGPVWLWVVGTTHPPLVLDAQSPFEEPELADPPAPMPPDEALTLAGRLLQRFVDDGRLVSLRAVREAIPLEPEPIFPGGKVLCQRSRKGRLFILIEEVEVVPA